MAKKSVTAKKIKIHAKNIINWIEQKTKRFAVSTLLSSISALIAYAAGLQGVQATAFVAAMKMLHHALKTEDYIVGKEKKINWNEVDFLIPQPRWGAIETFLKSPPMIGWEPLTTPAMPPSPPPPSGSYADYAKEVSDLQTKINKLEAELANAPERYGEYWKQVEGKKIKQLNTWKKMLSKIKKIEGDGYQWKGDGQPTQTAGVIPSRILNLYSLV